MKRKQKMKQISKNIFPKVGYMLTDVSAGDGGFLFSLLSLCLNISII